MDFYPTHSALQPEKVVLWIPRHREGLFVTSVGLMLTATNPQLCSSADRGSGSTTLPAGRGVKLGTAGQQGEVLDAVLLATHGGPVIWAQELTSSPWKVT